MCRKSKPFSTYLFIAEGYNFVGQDIISRHITTHAGFISLFHKSAHTCALPVLVLILTQAAGGGGERRDGKENEK